ELLEHERLGCRSVFGFPLLPFVQISAHQSVQKLCTQERRLIGEPQTNDVGLLRSRRFGGGDAERLENSADGGAHGLDVEREPVPSGQLTRGDAIERELGALNLGRRAQRTDGNLGWLRYVEVYDVEGLGIAKRY